MPVVAIRIGFPSSGVSDVKLMEFIPGVDYIKVHKFLSAHQSQQTSSSNACIESLSVTQGKALLLSLGIPLSSDLESDASSSELEDTSQSTEMSSVTLSEEPIVQVLRKSGWNCFECLDQIEQQMTEVESDRDDTQLNVFAEKMYSKLISSPELQAFEKNLLEQSHDACEATSATQVHFFLQKKTFLQGSQVAVSVVYWRNVQTLQL